jgi:transcriptional regulator of acetoin/glycerol metabolism
VLAALRPEPDLKRPSELTRDQIALALRDARGNVSRTATELGVTRDVLRRLIRKHGLGDVA